MLPAPHSEGSLQTPFSPLGSCGPPQVNVLSGLDYVAACLASLKAPHGLWNKVQMP